MNPAETLRCFPFIGDDSDSRSAGFLKTRVPARPVHKNTVWLQAFYHFVKPAVETRPVFELFRVAADSSHADHGVSVDSIETVIPGFARAPTHVVHDLVSETPQPVSELAHTQRVVAL